MQVYKFEKMSIPSSDIEDFASKLAKYNISLAQYKESLGEDEISSKLVIYFYSLHSQNCCYFRRKYDDDDDDNDTGNKVARTE